MVPFGEAIVLYNMLGANQSVSLGGSVGHRRKMRMSGNLDDENAARLDDRRLKGLQTHDVFFRLDLFIELEELVRDKAATQLLLSRYESLTHRVLVESDMFPLGTNKNIQLASSSLLQKKILRGVDTKGKWKC
jgi:hypothetical protein